MIWHGASTQADLPGLLASAHMFVHDGATMSLDNVLVEAIATSLLVVSSNLAYQEFSPQPAAILRFDACDSYALATKIKSLLLLTDNERSDLMKPLVKKVRGEYSVEHLVSGIVQQYEIRLHSLQ